MFHVSKYIVLENDTNVLSQITAATFSCGMRNGIKFLSFLNRHMIWCNDYNIVI